MCLCFPAVAAHISQSDVAPQNVEECLNNTAASRARRSIFPFTRQIGLKEADCKNRLWGLQYNEESTAVWIFLPNVLINRAFTSFQLSDSVLHP